MNEKYLPEGRRIGMPGNCRFTQSAASLEKARQSGAILEAVAVLCTGEMDLIVDLGEISGIIPRSEACYSPGGEVKDIAIITRVGRPVCFKVMSVDYSEKKPRAILSRRAAQEECEREYLADLIPGDIIPARVTHLENFGAFVDIGCGIVSLLSIDCISVSRISHPKERFSVGQDIYTVIRSTEDNGRIYVTHKELLGSWEENTARFEVGQTVAGIVRSVEEYGIFIELAPNLAGLAEVCGGVCVGQCAAVYIKNMIPEKMKVKLVIVDSGRAVRDSPKNDYFIDTSNVLHIDRWQYSPEGCSKIIETDFCPQRV